MSMTYSEKKEIVEQLRDAYNGVKLPEIKNEGRYFRQSTNTWFCGNRTSLEDSEIDRAITYFKQAENEFLSKGATDSNNLLAARYCQMAQAAILYAQSNTIPEQPKVVV